MNDVPGTATDAISMKKEDHANSLSTIKPSTRNQYFVSQKKTLSRSQILNIVRFLLHSIFE